MGQAAQAWAAIPGDSNSGRTGVNGCSEKWNPQNGTWVNGTKDENLREPGVFVCFCFLFFFWGGGEPHPHEQRERLLESDASIAVSPN